jgi:small redox-active disulfide protein 2
MSANPKLQVFGSGCTSCKRLHETVVRAAQELGLSAEVEYVTDITRLLELGVMRSPVFAIDGKPVAVGVIPSVEQVKELISGRS